MRNILSDVESCEKHDETKYSPIGRTTAEFWTLLDQNHGKGINLKE